MSTNLISHLFAIRMDPVIAAKRSSCFQMIVSTGIFLLLAAGSPVMAFPPAPFYTLYGTVRDQVALEPPVAAAVREIPAFALL